jgi:hypothetical protein
MGPQARKPVRDGISGGVRVVLADAAPELSRRSQWPAYRESDLVLEKADQQASFPKPTPGLEPGLQAEMRFGWAEFTAF